MLVLQGGTSLGAMAGQTNGLRDAKRMREEAVTSVQLKVNGVLYEGTVTPLLQQCLIVNILAKFRFILRNES